MKRRCASGTGVALALLLLTACPRANPPMTMDAEPQVDAAVADAEPLDAIAEIEDATPDASMEPDAFVPEDASEPDAEVADAGEPDGGIAFEYWANTQWPPYLTLTPGARATVYGQIWIESLTEAAGQAAGIEAELGVGPLGSDPATWTWVPAAYNVDAGNNDEYSAELTAPAPGLHEYAYRYRLNGSPWIYADRTGGSRAKLAVREAGAVLRVATLNLQCLNGDPIARLDAAAMRFASLGTDIVALQEVCEGAPVTNAAEHLAQALSAATGRTWRHRFAQTHLANGTTPEGVGVITALPIAEEITLDLPVADFPRRSVVLVVASPIGMVAFATAHLSFRAQDGQARLDQARAIIAEMDRLAATDLAAAVVAGDFNATPLEPPPSEMIGAGFLDAWASANPGDDGFTHSTTNPARRIDYLFARPALAWPLEVPGAAIEFDQPYAAGSFVSDHRGVSAEIRAN
jgi:endonuclease/exonuclease/phosphatase family metal-dependent hydrolase